MLCISEQAVRLVMQGTKLHFVANVVFVNRNALRFVWFILQWMCRHSLDSRQTLRRKKVTTCFVAFV